MSPEGDGGNVIPVAAKDAIQRRAAIRLGALALLLWLALGTVRTGPFYLTYFNELVGGPANGYKYLAGPDVDWGQGLKGLAAYLHQHGIRMVKLAYFGTDDPRMYGIEYELLRPGEPTTGNVAISVSFLWRLHGFPNCDGEYAWLEQYEPIAQVGYSIFLYHIPSTARLPPPVSVPPSCRQRSPLFSFF